MPRVIAIDFDGVLINRSGIPRTYGWGDDKPMEYAKEAVEFLMKKGYDCVILTSRTPEDWPVMRKWLNRHSFPWMEITNVKRDPMVIIDDRAIRFTNWQDICKYFG